MAFRPLVRWNVALQVRNFFFFFFLIKSFLHFSDQLFQIISLELGTGQVSKCITAKPMSVEIREKLAR
jgi:hypothetical protein